MGNKSDSKENVTNGTTDGKRISRKKLLLSMGAVGMAMASGSIFGGDTAQAAVGPDTINVLATGAVGDGSADDTAALQEAINRAATGGILFFPPGTYKVGSALTFPKHVMLQFAPGAMLAPATGVAITLDSFLQAGYYQIFAGEGSIKGKLQAPFVVPQWWGAVADGVKDDTKPVQAALDFAGKNGARVYLPKGQYYTTAPLVLQWAEGNSSMIGGIFGDGYQSTIKGKITQAPKPEETVAILELIGESNKRAVSIRLEDFCIKMEKGSLDVAFCLRAGNCKDYLTAERLWLEGANALSMRISSSDSYAQIATVFRQCTFYPNYNFNWYAEKDVNAKVYAVYSESKGASWDNVRFEGCEFHGVVQTRAHVATFENCMFSTPPERNEPYCNNLEVRIGNATVKNCYFEDHKYAIVVAPTLGAIRTVSIEDSHFSGRTNLGNPSTRAIVISDATGKVDAVDIIRCEFGDVDEKGNPLYLEPCIYNNGGANVRIENAANIFNRSLPVRVQNRLPNFSMLLPRQSQVSRTERVRFWGKTGTGTLATTLEGFSKLGGYLITRQCWISKLTVMVDQKLVGDALRFDVSATTPATPTDKITTAAIKSFPGTNTYTLMEDNGGQIGSLAKPANLIFNEGDKLSVKSTAADGVTEGIAFCVEVELAY